jgi:hypothetical protein
MRHYLQASVPLRVTYTLEQRALARIFSGVV